MLIRITGTHYGHCCYITNERPRLPVWPGVFPIFFFHPAGFGLYGVKRGVPLSLHWTEPGIFKTRS